MCGSLQTRSVYCDFTLSGGRSAHPSSGRASKMMVLMSSEASRVRDCVFCFIVDYDILRFLDCLRKGIVCRLPRRCLFATNRLSGEDQNNSRGLNRFHSAIEPSHYL